MRILLDVRKSIEQNAAVYYEKAKKAKHKLEGAEKALKSSLLKLEKIEEEQKAVQKPAEAVAKKWYEKFRWFYSSEGFLCIGGRDATSNEVLVKKHAEPNDLVFHSHIAGSPFFVIKTEGKAPGEATMEEAAQATGSFSRAWKLGLSMQEVFSVKPEQVSKTAKSGEYMEKGAFMISGKTANRSVELKLAVGLYEGRIMVAPLSAIKKHSEKHLEVVQGEMKPSEAAKKIRKQLGGELDDIIRALPSGGIKLK